MDRSGRNEQNIAGFGLHLFTTDLAFPRAFDHIDDFLAGMSVAGKDGSRFNFDANLNDFTTGHTEIVSLQLSASGFWLRPDGVQRQHLRR